MSDARICFVFPSRERPERFFKAIENIIDNCDGKNFFIVVKLDDDDPLKEQYLQRLNEFPELIVKWGKSKGKVSAVNRDSEDALKSDIIVVQSEDMVWECFGFDNEIREDFKKVCPNLDGVIHYPDGFAGDRTMTLTVMGVELYKQLGYLYHPDFLSVYCDNHLTELTRIMGKYAYINKQLFRHHHPIHHLSDWDELYRRNEAPEFYHIDHETYKRHKENNFYL